MQEVNQDENHERDINDVFNDILLSEEQLIKDSYNKGYELGKAQGNSEAYHLGYHRGAELGAEIGYYTSFTETYLNNIQDLQSPDSDKVVKLLEHLRNLLSTFPRRNDPEVDILNLIDQIRAKFKKSLIKQEIENLLKFLEPLLSLANSHMVDFFTKSSYATSIPKDIQNEIKQISHKKAINSIFKNELDQTPFLKKFIANSLKFTLKNSSICLSSDNFIEKLQKWGCDNIEKFKLEIFMSAKKSHEVEVLSAILAAITNVADVSHVIDIGDGKGYLSSMLSFHHGIPVLGVDASNINTCGAIKRATKLSRVWKGISAAPNKSYPSKNDNTATENVNLYKQVTQYVDDNFDLQRLVLETFKLEPVSLRLGMVGLHTCGNLSSNSLKIFCKNESVKLLCNVGCCYHLLDERFEGESNIEVGFPLSRYLSGKQTVIGRSARMIANQSVDRILEAKELPNVTIYYRALLQVILEHYCTDLPSKHVGKFRKLPQNFVEYARTALKRIDVEIDISDQQIDHYHSLYQNRMDELNVFYLLRCRLAPVVESLILLDRLLFLHEQGFTDSYLVQFFDPVVSPRCYGIVAIKEQR